MNSNKLQRIQLEFYQGLCPTDFSLKGFLRFGKLVIANFKKAKSYLRSDPDNPHWLAIKEVSLGHLLVMQSCFESHFSCIEPEEEQMYIALTELVCKCSEAVYEESKIDDLSKKEDPDELTLTKEQLEALARL